MFCSSGARLSAQALWHPPGNTFCLPQLLFYWWCNQTLPQYICKIKYINHLTSISNTCIWNQLKGTCSLADVKLIPLMLASSESITIMTELLYYVKWTYPQNAVVFFADEIVRNKGPMQGSINMFILLTSWQGLGSVVTRVVLTVDTNGEMESTGVVILVTGAAVDSTKGFSRRNVPKQQYKTNTKIIEQC